MKKSKPQKLKNGAPFLPKEPGTLEMTFLPLKKKVSFAGFPSILELAIANDVDLGHSCGGMGSCTTCRVFVTKGSEKLAPPDDVEKEHAEMRGYAPNERLACQTLAVDEIEVTIPPQADVEDVR